MFRWTTFKFSPFPHLTIPGQSIILNFIAVKISWQLNFIAFPGNIPGEFIFVRSGRRVANCNIQGRRTKIYQGGKLFWPPWAIFPLLGMISPPSGHAFSFFRVVITTYCIRYFFFFLFQSVQSSKSLITFLFLKILIWNFAWR